MSLKGKFILLLQQSWNNSPNPDFQDQFHFEPTIQTFFNTPAKALKHILFKKNAFV